MWFKYPAGFSDTFLKTRWPIANTKKESMIESFKAIKTPPLLTPSINEFANNRHRNRSTVRKHFHVKYSGRMYRYRGQIIDSLEKIILFPGRIYIDALKRNIDGISSAASFDRRSSFNSTRWNCSTVRFCVVILRIQLLCSLFVICHVRKTILELKIILSCHTDKNWQVHYE